MSKVIAIVWDFDKTLIPGYMQDPIFEKYGVDGQKFWIENNKEIAEYQKQKLDVNSDTYYLNRFIRMSQSGQPFDGLDNATLLELGKKLDFYDGILDLFKEIKSLNQRTDYQEFGIQFEIYIVSTGFKKMIEGSKISEYVNKIWGAELIDRTDSTNSNIRRISEIAYSLDNTTKTRALFEINKGVGIFEGATIDVNSKIPLQERRVLFSNMIYIADGPSDIPAFSVLNQKGGYTLAVYSKGNAEAFSVADELIRANRVQMVAEADYTQQSCAYMWIMLRLKELAQNIIKQQKEAFNVHPGTPKHQV